MGRSIFEIDRLGAPLHRLLDRVMNIPGGRRLVLDNVAQKIVILLEGAVKAMVNGRAVGEMRPGDALVIPGPCHQTYIPLDRRRETRMRGLIVVFQPGLFACEESLLRAMPVAGADAETPEGFVQQHFGSVQLRRGILTPAALEWIEAVRREAEERGSGYRLRVSAFVLLLLTEIARRKASPAADAGQGMSRQEWMIEETKHFLLEHHAETVTLDQVAWHLRLSGEHLARTFRKETGQTIFGYLQRLRLERAKAQLAGSPLAVHEIARQAGFGTAAQLCRTFRRATGETPLAYRLRMAGKAGFSPSITEEIVF